MNLAIWLPMLKFLGIAVMGLCVLGLAAVDRSVAGKQRKAEDHLARKAA